MRYVVQYTNVIKRTPEELEGEVMNLLQKGWDPLGGLVMYHKGGLEYTFVQTMVKYVETFKSETSGKPT